MKKVIMYKCEQCGDLFDSEKRCIEHEYRHKMINKANKMLEYGHTLKEIQEECNVWYSVPKHLENVSTHNCFIISHWQCCDKPAYTIDYIYMDGRVRVWGCGSWNGYYGEALVLSSIELMNPHPKEELFIDKRYFNM